MKRILLGFLVFSRLAYSFFPSVTPFENNHGQFQYEFLSHIDENKYFHTFRVGILNRFQIEMRNQGRTGNALISGFAFSTHLKKFEKYPFVLGFRSFDEQAYWGGVQPVKSRNQFYLSLRRNFENGYIILGAIPQKSVEIPLILGCEFNLDFVKTSMDYDGEILHFAITKNIWNILDVCIGGYFQHLRNPEDSGVSNNGFAIGLNYNSFLFARSLGNSTLADVEPIYLEQIEYYQPVNVEKRIEKHILKIENEIIEFMDSAQKEYNKAIASIDSVKHEQKKDIEVMTIEITLLEGGVTEERLNEINRIVDKKFRSNSKDNLEKISNKLTLQGFDSADSISLAKSEKIIVQKIESHEFNLSSISDKIQPNRDVGPTGGMNVIYENLVYPEEAKTQFLQGEVVVNVFIDKHGQISDISFTNPEYLDGVFNSSVENAIRKTKFNTASDGLGNPISGRVELTIKFTFSD